MVESNNGQEQTTPKKHGSQLRKRPAHWANNLTASTMWFKAGIGLDELKVRGKGGERRGAKETHSCQQALELAQHPRMLPEPTNPLVPS